MCAQRACVTAIFRKRLSVLVIYIISGAALVFLGSFEEIRAAVIIHAILGSLIGREMMSYLDRRTGGPTALINARVDCRRLVALVSRAGKVCSIKRFAR